MNIQALCNGGLRGNSWSLSYFARKKSFIHKYLTHISSFWDNTSFIEFEIFGNFYYSFFLSAHPLHHTTMKKMLRLVSENLIRGSDWFRSTSSEMKGTARSTDLWKLIVNLMMHHNKILVKIYVYSTWIRIQIQSKNLF